ncbi:MAG: CHAT domain-containing protein [Mycobacterium leprae]
MDEGDLEIGLQWDRRQDKFYVSNRFAMIAENVDDWESAEEPLSIDVQELKGLIADERAYGAALTRMVLRPKDVEPFYLRARARTEGSGCRLHMRIHLSVSAPVRYHTLRWELLCDPDTGTPIATRSNVLLSRYLSSPDWRPIPAPDRHDLCALTVVAGPNNLQDYRPKGRKLGEVKIDEELARVQTALSGIPGIRSVHNLPGAATLTSIIEALEQGVDDRAVDILYLVCHGVLIEDVPWLYLENSDRTVDVVDGRRLVESLSELERRPMMIMLCSCQSASAGTEMWSGDDGELSALGPRLASAGVGAVVAMQGNISMTTAETFAPTFFRTVAQHGVADEAMAAARRAIRERPDWWVPVLFSRLRSGRTYYTSGFVKREQQTWDSLVLQVKSRHFTPLIGPMLASRILGSREDIARAWAQRWQMPIASHNQGDLAQVAQYLRVRTTPGFVRVQLQEHMMNEIRQRQRGLPKDPIWSGLPSALVRGIDPSPAIHAVGQRLRFSDQGDPYRILADLEACLYVTTGWTDLLEDALKDQAREPITMMFPWNEQIVMGEATTRYEGTIPTVERPVVYHLYGRLEDLSSLVLTEDDYFVWLNAWATRRESVPSFVRKALVTSSLLFLGYRLDDWDFRVLFQSIKNLGGSGLLRENQHVGVQLSRESSLIEPEAVQQYLEWSLGEAKVSIYWGNTEQFLTDIHERIALGR